MLINPQVLQTLKLRSCLERSLSKYLDEQEFERVSTPLLAAQAGGAVARPFETVATELRNTTLNLRVAPELWLKRLVVGGMGKIYEIGPAFRNEGQSSTALM
jgi:lysyl-tRNA synthetase class 2